ncbi:UPF0764 protein C16orf89-like isoform X3 [Biomphalaria glabrata]|uniref:UPF0764 protein C16orf89-like isoform X3 n=1 Tax=Biomphalaria glabrata TaxID=6526 RepID=A0A9W2YGY7_BIOGL|nr:UPF0764 protein C16orf89-like isoform X3 [Biomphalaria glabrata]
MSRSMYITAFCGVLVCLLMFTSGVSANEIPAMVSKESLPELFEKSLRAVEKAINFFGEDYSALNVDGLFGIRICQGALLQAKQDCESGKLDCPVDLVYTLNKYVTSMDDYGNKALAYIEAEDSSYFEQFLDTINSPYTFDVKLDSLGDTSGVTPGTDGSYDEVRGDRCLSLILGSYEKNEGKYPKCSVDQECWTMMTKGNTMAYVITHQLLYFVMVEKSGCVAPIEELVYKYNKTSLRDFEKRLCKSIYVEAQQEEVGNSVKELKQDLFLEQLLLCSLVGFQEFFQEKWIRLVLSWQKPRGCYGMPASLMKVEAELTRVQEDEKHLLQLLTEEAEKM